MTITRYDYDVVAANNNAAPPDGFPESMQFSEVNDAMREHMARRIRFAADGGGAALPNFNALAPNSAGAIDRLITLTQGITKVRDGLLVTFRVKTTANENAVWLGLGDGNFYPLVHATGGAVPTNTLVAGAIYAAVFHTDRWQLLCNVQNSGTFVPRPRREETPATGIVQLEAADVGGRLHCLLDTVNNPGATLTLNIRKALVQRWPIGASILITSISHTDLFITADADAGVSIGNVNPATGGAVALVTNKVMVGKLTRTSALDIDYVRALRNVL